MCRGGQTGRMPVWTLAACRLDPERTDTTIIIIKVVLTDVVINGGGIICG